MACKTNNYMKIGVLSILYCAVLTFISACQPKAVKTYPGQVYQFDLQQIAQSGTLPHEWVKSAEFGEKVLSFTVGENNNELVLTADSKDIDWVTAKYIVCEVWHDNPYSALLNLQFYRKKGADLAGVRQGEEDETKSPEEGPRISVNTGIMPSLKTKMIFPLFNLDGQRVNLPRFAPQMKSVAVGRRVDPEEVGKVVLRINPCEAPDYLTKIQIAAIYLTAELPEPYEKPAALVDSFGQWTARDWPGKIHSSNELKASMTKTEAIAVSADFPDDWSIYGGWKQLRFKPKGFFYTHHDGKRWWFVDPEGYAFISAGITGIQSSASGVLRGQEELFSWLPPQNDPLFAAAYQTGRDNNSSASSVDFLRVNMMRVWGADWKQKWEETTVGLMKHWRVNTVANWSDSEMARRQKIPYMINLSRFPTTPVRVYRDFPDVFDPAYLEAAKTFAEQLRPVKDDPYLIGYFLANEPGWAFGGNNIAFEMFATDLQSFTKKEMVRWLQKKYVIIKAFNDAWKLNMADFNSIESLTMKDRPSEIAWNDCMEFSGLMVDHYVQSVCKEVKKVDPNHLNLGLRYASIHSDLHYRAGEWFDVFSINGYRNPAPPPTDEVNRRTGLPVLIGEWHFGCAIDGGLPATGIQPAESQEARGDAYRYYFENGALRPELIAMHWFQWNDQPIFGRGDGENYNIGFMDICNQPYAELTKQAKAAHENMYKIAAGTMQPYNKEIRKVPKIAY